MSSTPIVLLTGGSISPGVNLPQLVVNGQFLGLSNGQRWTAIEASDFNLLARYDVEGPDAIRPVLAQRAALGFNVLRVWTSFDIPLIGTYPICAYQKIPAFVAFCALYGLYVEFTAYTGINDPLHWQRLIDAAAISTPRPLLELVNELDQNTNEPDSQERVFDLSLHGQAPSPLLSAHGSNGSQTWPVEPHWSYATFHTNGADEEQRKVGHNAMEIWGGPTLTNETSRCPDAYTSTTFAYDCAAGAALLCAGSCFHSVNGKVSQLWTGDELACATAWAEGARSVPLDCQAGPYKHRADLEQPTDLRVYQRGDSGVCIVEIRA